MKSMDKISAGLPGTSAGSAGYWFYSGLIRSVRLVGLRLVYWGVWFWKLPDLSDKSVLPKSRRQA